MDRIQSNQFFYTPGQRLSLAINIFLALTLLLPICFMELDVQRGYQTSLYEAGRIHACMELDRFRLTDLPPTQVCRGVFQAVQRYPELISTHSYIYKSPIYSALIVLMVVAIIF